MSHLQNLSQVGSNLGANQLPPEVLNLQAMADWPRWLEEDVDSQAMLSAYQWYLHVSKQTMGPLPIIVHRSAFTEPLPAPKGTMNILCTAESCERCLSGRGGYRFRWYSRHWIDRYKTMAREGAWGATVTKAPLPPVPLFASKAPEVGVQGPELTGLSGKRTSVSLPPRELEGLCCQQMATGKNCCSMYQLADDSSPDVHTSVPVSRSENTAPLIQSNRHPEAEDEQEERQWDTCSQCGVYRLFSRLSDEACMRQQGIACDFAGDKPRNPDLIDPWRLTAEMLARYWAEQAADSSGSD